MKITRKKEFVIETERRVTIKFGENSERFCRLCNARTRFITVNEAAILRGTTSREIFHLVEAGQIHFEETAEGFLLICLASHL